jgi:hypothetical protein
MSKSIRGEDVIIHYELDSLATLVVFNVIDGLDKNTLNRVLDRCWKRTRQLETLRHTEKGNKFTIFLRQFWIQHGDVKFAKDIEKIESLRIFPDLIRDDYINLQMREDTTLRINYSGELVSWTGTYAYMCPVKDQWRRLFREIDLFRNEVIVQQAWEYPGTRHITAGE